MLGQKPPQKGMTVIVNTPQGPREFPAFALGWDDQAKSVVIPMPLSEGIPNFEFVLAMLGMASEHIKHQITLVRMAQMQHQQQEAAEAQAIANRLNRGPGPR